MTRLGWLLAAVVLWAACGGDVVVDDPPEGSGASGTGASGASGASGPGPSSGTGAATTSTATGTGAVGGGAPGSPCEPACSALANCTAVDCIGGCLSTNPSCLPSFEPFLDCVAAQTDPATCDLPLDCVPLLQSWLVCANFCIHDEFGCFAADDGTCGCTVTADCGPASVYETSCTPVGGDVRSCDCLADGVTMGRCIDEPTTACDPFLGCCAALFFVPGGSG